MNKKGQEACFKSLISQNLKQYGMIGALVALVVFFQISTNGLLLLPNSFVALIQQNAYVLILSIGMVMIIIATHIYLSVGSQVAFIGGILAFLMEKMHVNWVFAIFVAIAVGLLIGAWHGFWVAYVGIPGFITTLAGMLLFRGLSTILVGESVPIKSQAYRNIAKGYLPNVLGFAGPFDVLTLVIEILIIVFIIIVFIIYSTLRHIKRAISAGITLSNNDKTLKYITACVPWDVKQPFKK